MTNGNQPTNEQSLADLQNRLALIQARLGIQQANWQLATQPLTAPLELIRQLFPQGQTAPPAGTITTTGDWSYAPGISLAYQVIEEELVDKLIDQLQKDFVETLDENDKEKTKLLIVDNLQYAPEDLPLTEVTVSFRSFEGNLKRQAENIDKVKNSLRTPEAPQAGAGPQPEALPALVAVATPIALGLAAAPSIISTLAGVAGYFQSTYSVTGQKFDVPTEGLLAAVASKLNKNVKVCVSNFYAIGESALLDRFMALQDQALDLKTKRDELANQIAKPLNDQVASLNQQIRDLESRKNTLDSAAKQSEIQDINHEIAELKQRLQPIQHAADVANVTVQASDAILSEYATFKTAITTSVDRQPTKLAQAMLRDKIYQAGITHMLFLKIIFSGGQAITEEKWGPDKIIYMGETGLSFLLATLDGDVLSSGLLRGIRDRKRNL